MQRDTPAFESAGCSISFKNVRSKVTKRYTPYSISGSKRIAVFSNHGQAVHQAMTLTPQTPGIM
jgi:hypothetical protein